MAARSSGQLPPTGGVVLLCVAGVVGEQCVPRAWHGQPVSADVA
jgi:hypothetical protein